MNATERYVRQATRGLSGQARRDAQMELRGAIEDKAWRLTLLGLEPQEATRRAVRELGSPHAVAGGLARVHTLPKAALAAVLAGVAALLGVQALAAVPVVRAIPDPAYKFCVFDETQIRRMTPQMQTDLRAQLAQPGGRAKAEAECRANSPVPTNNLLRLSDLTAALAAGGVKVRSVPQLDGFLNLTFPGDATEYAVNLSDGTQKVAGQPHVQLFGLVSHLRTLSGVPVRLTGDINPVLQIGPAKLQLGTREHPVRAAEIYASALFRLLDSRLDAGPGPAFQSAFITDGPGPSRNRVALQAPEGAYFVTLSNEDFFLPDRTGDRFYSFRIQVLQSGVLPVPFAVGAKGNIVSSRRELVEATRTLHPALLVYRLDTSDLRNLRLTPVPASYGLRFIPFVEGK